jgi:PBP1b-binding outer membrane lipoprotein LpoB
MTEEVKNQEPVAEQVPAQEQPPVDLTVQDLAGLRSIIDVASQRGAFKAAEMEAVGKLFNKLNGFLEAVTKQGPKENG